MHRLLLALLLCAAACQPVPHPFEDADRLPTTPALRPPDSAGIMVLPVAGAPGPAGERLAASMAAALLKADIPASTGPMHRGSYRLAATVTTEPLAGGGLAVAIDWLLTSAAGDTVGRQSSRRETQSALWQAGDAALADALAGEAAPGLANLVFGDAPLPSAVDPLLAVGSVTGAPGDGSEALARAIDTALRHANIDVASAGQAKAAFVLKGRVEMSPPHDGKQQVKVRWILAGADGRELGQVSQENAVPAGSLDGSWGDVAYAVASAAAPGIADLLAQARKLPAGS
jgi:hypothetical protein